ncbi:MAG: NfeD family protein [Mariprofundaceae bacterium]
MFTELEFAYWHGWLIAACVIAVMELLMGSYYLLALVGASTVAGLYAWLFDASMTIQWIVFTVATVASGLLLYWFRKGDKPKDIDNISHMVGKQVQIIDTVNPRGRAIYKSVAWAAESQDLIDVGKPAVIERVDGSTLYIKEIKA